MSLVGAVWLLPLALWLSVPAASPIAIGLGFSLVFTLAGLLVWRWLERLLRRAERRDTLLDTLAVTDPMTGVFNHRGFMEILERDYARGRRYNHPLSLMRLDIDFFRRINDGYGHGVGDEVIIELATTSRETLRLNIDVLGRLSGSGFAILLPDTNKVDATRFAERLRERIAGIEVATARGDHVHFTVSIGVAELASCDDSARALLARAEQALQGAKDNGRNRVAISVPTAASA
jgi:two-component system, cell cycle response regulator